MKITLILLGVGKKSQFGQTKSKAQKQQVTVKDAELNVTEPKYFLLKWKLQ